MNTENIGKKHERPDQQWSVEDEEEEQEVIFPEIETTVDYAIEHITEYTESILSEMSEQSDRHSVIVAMIKYFKQLGIKYERESIIDSIDEMKHL